MLRRSGLALWLVLGGCGAGVHWQGPTFPDAHAVARGRNRLTFVYFRSWYAKECTSFEENILKDIEVLVETSTMVNVPLDFDWDRPLADRWAVSAVPAFVIVDPDGNTLASGQGAILRAELLHAIRQAKRQFGHATTSASGTQAAP